jgi:glycosyltransferase involved in cell wall biosynthesis
VRGVPKVSVIVCAYNAQAYLRATLESVLAQTYRDFELVVVDDGSTDDTGAIVRSFEGKGPVVYRRQANAGFGAARNAAVALSRGEWIAVIDHDDLCLPNRLERQLAAAEARPDAALVFSDSEHFLGDGRVLRRNFDAFNPCRSDLSAGKGAELLLTRGCFIDSETAFFRRDAALAVGGFPVQYRYVADYDFFLRLAERHALAGVDEVLARWRVHEGQLTHTAKDTVVREHIALLGEWSRRPGLGAHARRVAGLREAAYLARAAASPALRRELGATRLLGGAVRRLPEACREAGWLLGRLTGQNG